MNATVIGQKNLYVPGLVGILARMGQLDSSWPAAECHVLRADWRHATYSIETAAQEMGSPDEADELISWVYSTSEFQNYRLVTREIFRRGERRGGADLGHVKAQ